MILNRSGLRLAMSQKGITEHMLIKAYGRSLKKILIEGNLGLNAARKISTILECKISDFVDTQYLSRVKRG